MGHNITNCIVEQFKLAQSQLQVSKLGRVGSRSYLCGSNAKPKNGDLLGDGSFGVAVPMSVLHSTLWFKIQEEF